jgi:hypothetical protein
MYRQPASRRVGASTSVMVSASASSRPGLARNRAMMNRVVAVSASRSEADPDRGVPKLQNRPSGSRATKPRGPRGESASGRTMVAPASRARAYTVSGSRVSTWIAKGG